MKRDTATDLQRDGVSPESAGGGSAAMLSIDADIFRDVPVSVEARLGAATMTIKELLALRSGSVVKLDLKMNEPIELSLNNAVVARGEIVAVDDSFGVRITEVAQIK